MDDDANQLLREILKQQTKQTELLQKYLPPLWTKIRFSLLTLLLLTSGVAIGWHRSTKDRRETRFLKHESLCRKTSARSF